MPSLFPFLTLSWFLNDVLDKDILLLYRRESQLCNVNQRNVLLIESVIRLDASEPLYIQMLHLEIEKMHRVSV